MMYIIALLFGILAYVVIKFILEKIPSLAGLSEILGIIGGIVVALFYMGALR